jgi:hypothetical protein
MLPFGNMLRSVSTPSRSPQVKALIPGNNLAIARVNLLRGFLL